MELTSLLCYVYLGLTATKISQWLIMAFMSVRSADAKADNTIDCGPSMKVTNALTDYLLLVRHEKSITKIPRKELRDITDPWVEKYTAQVIRDKGAEPKVYSSLHDAMSAFYMEFCQESSDFTIHWSLNGFAAFLRQPLGLNATFAVLYFVGIFPIMAVRESKRLGGNVLSLICKMAASATIAEVYVVSCKEQLSFEKTLTRYPWASGLFTRKQVHPLIGKNACPLYKREIPFPVKNHVMDFEYDVIDASLALLRQRHDSFVGDLREDIHVSQVVLACMTMYLCYLDFVQGNVASFSWLWKIGPYAAGFYIVRELVDWQLGIKWHPKYHFLL